MLPAPELFQTAPARQNSKISRPSLLRNFRLPVPVLLHPRLPECLQQLREGKREPSEKELSMNTNLAALIVFGCLAGAILLGRALRRVLPEDHLTADSRDTIKLAMGLVATMSALVLGLLVSSAKGAYDTERSEVIQMAAKVTFLGRVLAAYGPEAAGVRAQLRETMEEGIRQMWPGEMRRPARLAPNTQAANAAYGAIQALSPHNDMQAALKAQAASLAIDVAQVRSLLVAQS